MTLIACRATMGCGPSRLSAFHDALRSVAADDYNIIKLSSVVPAGWQVRSGEGPIPRRRIDGSPAQVGDRLYAVFAAGYAERGATAVAGLGWAQAVDRSRGYLMEVVGTSWEVVRQEIDESLAAMLPLAADQIVKDTLLCEASTSTHRIACALVLAPYGVEAWNESGASETRRGE